MKAATLLGILIAAAAFVMPAHAGIQDFRSHAPLTLTGKDALHRAALPLEAYRDARKDLADVRVLNAAGEPVPMAWAGDPDPTRRAPPAIGLPIFPITQLAPRGKAAVAEISVRASDGTLVAVKPRAAGKALEPRPVAYVLDASKVKGPVRGLVLDWKAGPGHEVVKVRVEASDDLKEWTTVASAPVVRIESAGRSLTQPRLELAPRKSKYYRLTGQAPEFTLTAARAEPEDAVQPAPRATHRANGAPGKPNEYTYDLGARLPVSALRLVPAETNAVLAASFHTREADKAPWRLITSGTFHRLQLDGTEFQSPPIEITRHAARYWTVRLAPGSSVGAPPALEVQWRPAQVVFVAQGAAPYTLAFGNEFEKPAALPVASLIPSYERLAELELPEARVGAVATGPEPAAWKRWAKQLDARRATLWAILLAGVALLGYMAWRLSRQMQEKPGTDPRFTPAAEAPSQHVPGAGPRGG